MAATSYEEVLRLARELDAEEKQTLVEALQEEVEQVDLDFAAWDELFHSLIIERPILWDFSPKRSDWYDDDGR